MKGRVWVALVWALSLLPSAYLAWQGRDLPALGSFHDDAIYLETARGLAVDGEYRIGSLPWTPAQTKYPPLYPMYLSMAWRAAAGMEQVLPVAMWLNWLWLPVWCVGIHRLLVRERFPPWLAVALPAWVALNPETQLAATRLMSDLMYAALLTWTMALYPSRGGYLTAALAYFTRTAALPLYAGWIVLEAVRREWRRLAVALVAAAAPVGAWAWWVAVHWRAAGSMVEKYYTDYLAYQMEVVKLADLPAHVYRQLDVLISSISQLLLADFGSSFGWMTLSRVVSAAAVVGIVRLMRRGRMTAFGCYAALAAGMSLVWYFAPEPRFVLPILPLLAVGLYTEAEAFAAILREAWNKRGGERVFAAACAGLCALMLLAMVRNGVNGFVRYGEAVILRERESQAHVLEAYRWVRDNTGADVTFFAVDDPAFYLYTGRRALRIPRLDRTLTEAGEGRYRPSKETLTAMRQFGLNCLFFSTKNFDAAGGVLRMDVRGTGLMERYRTPTEVVACRSE